MRRAHARSRPPRRCPPASPTALRTRSCTPGNPASQGDDLLLLGRRDRPRGTRRPAASRWPVVVDDAPRSARAPRSRCTSARRSTSPHEEGAAQRGDPLTLGRVRQQLPHRGGEVRHGDPRLAHPPRQLAGRPHLVRLRRDDGRAQLQRGEDVAVQRVVRQAAKEAEAVAAPSPKLARAASGVEVRERPVPPHHRLGRPRGPRGEATVRQRRPARPARTRRDRGRCDAVHLVRRRVRRADGGRCASGRSRPARRHLARQLARGGEVQVRGGARDADVLGQAGGADTPDRGRANAAPPSSSPSSARTSAALAVAVDGHHVARPHPAVASRCAMRSAAASSSAYVHVSRGIRDRQRVRRRHRPRGERPRARRRARSRPSGSAGSGRTPRAASVASDSAPTRVSGAAAAWRSTPSSCASSPRIRGASKRSAA